MNPRARFWDRIADGYARQPIGDEAAYEEKLQRSRAYMTPDSRVLEFACGTGGTALAHAPFVRQITAIDVSEGMLAHARRKQQDSGISNIEFIHSDIESFPVQTGAFDLVLGMSILHLLDDRRSVMQQVFDRLKPDGVFISSTVCLGDWMPWFRFIAPLGRLSGKMPKVRTVKRQQLLQELEAMGFEVIESWQPAQKSALFVAARKPAVQPQVCA